MEGRNGRQGGGVGEEETGVLLDDKTGRAWRNSRLILVEGGQLRINSGDFRLHHRVYKKSNNKFLGELNYQKNRHEE